MGEELCHRGAMKMVVRLISHSSGVILEESLKVALALVQGGNEVAQFCILDYIQHSIGEDNFFGRYKYTRLCILTLLASTFLLTNLHKN
jgi:hypothetical protein